MNLPPLRPAADRYNRPSTRLERLKYVVDAVNTADPLSWRELEIRCATFNICVRRGRWCKWDADLALCRCDGELDADQAASYNHQ